MENRTKRTPRRGGLALASLRRGGQVAEVWRWTRTARPFCCDSSWLKSHFAFPSFWFLPSTCHNPPGCLGVRRIRPPPGRRQTGSGHRQPGPPGTAPSCSSWVVGRDRTTERSGVVRALETKFLLFWAGQKQDNCPVRFRPRLAPSQGFWRARCGSFLVGAAVVLLVSFEGQGERRQGRRA